jgi:hypothetical protein
MLKLMDKRKKRKKYPDLSRGQFLDVYDLLILHLLEV